MNRPSSRTTPASNLEGVAATQPVSVVFDKAVKSGATLTLVDAGGNGVNGQAAYDASTRTLTFTAASALAAGVKYTAAVTATATNNVPMAAPYTWSFSTATAVGQCPATLWTTAAVPSTPRRERQRSDRGRRQVPGRCRRRNLGDQVLQRSWKRRVARRTSVALGRSTSRHGRVLLGVGHRMAASELRHAHRSFGGADLRGVVLRAARGTMPSTPADSTEPSIVLRCTPSEASPLVGTASSPTAWDRSRTARIRGPITGSTSCSSIRPAPW